uniref:Pseudouridine synthase RsuA/RluA-like domain-containing protein n=1 Tax=Alexandrium monilatum TaxID=311494 RepID=A0A7S4US21_9DINO
MLVVGKPSGWEVDGATTDFNPFIGQRLSTFVQARASPEIRPLSYDEDFDYGFIHRLDVPSSGLVLTGNSFEGLYSIRGQLNGHAIEREYFIVCHGGVPAELRHVDARIDIRATLTNEAATICPFGKPARTYIKAVAHAPWKGRLPCAVSLTAIRIHTGRRHQIRVHLQHCGHAPVSDGRYPVLQLHLLGQRWSLQ